MKPQILVGLALIATFVAGASTMHVIDENRGRKESGAWEAAEAKLGLTNQQHDGIAKVFARHQRASDAIMQSMIPRMTALADSINEEIEALLTPEQRKQFATMRHKPVFVLRRKVPGGIKIDTVSSVPARR